MRRLPMIAIALVALLAACNNEKTPGNQEATANTSAPAPEAGVLDRSHAGSPAPATAFFDPDGERVSLAGFRGRPVLLNLWATWCAPCITEMPTLDALAAGQAGIKVLTVSQDLGGKEQVDPFFAKHGFRNIEAYVDSEGQLSTDTGVQTLPTTILYDAKGKEVWRISGIEDWRGTHAAALLKEASAA